MATASLLAPATTTPAPTWTVDFTRDRLDSAESDLRILDGSPASMGHPQGPVTIATFNVRAYAPWIEEAVANAYLAAGAPAMKAILHACETFLDAEVQSGTRPAEAARLLAAIRSALATTTPP